MERLLFFRFLLAIVVEAPGVCINGEEFWEVLRGRKGKKRQIGIWCWFAVSVFVCALCNDSFIEWWLLQSGENVKKLDFLSEFFPVYVPWFVKFLAAVLLAIILFKIINFIYFRIGRNVSRDYSEVSDPGRVADRHRDNKKINHRRKRK